MASIIRRSNVRAVEAFRFSGVESEPAVSPPQIAPGVSFPTVSELDAIRSRGYEDGYAAGRAEAALRFEQGTLALEHTLGQIAGALHALDHDFSQAFSMLLKTVGDALAPIDTAELARRIHTAAELMDQGSGWKVFVSADDEALLRELGVELPTTDLVVDQQLMAGEFRLEGASGTVEATLAARLAAIKEALHAG